MDLSFLAFQQARYFQIRPVMVFGNYSFYSSSRTEHQLSAEVYALKTCPDPMILWASGIKYVYVDEVWLANASAEGRALLENPELFELMIVAEKKGEMRRLYRVLEPSVLLEEISLIQWMPPSAYYSPPPILEEAQRVFYPASLPYWYRLLFSAMEENEFESEAQSFIQEWRSSKDPNALLAANVDYLVIDNVWLQYASEEEVALLNDPRLYEKVGEWGFKRCTPVQIFRPLGN